MYGVGPFFLFGAKCDIATGKIMKHCVCGIFL